MTKSMVFPSEIEKQENTSFSFSKHFYTKAVTKFFGPSHFDPALGAVQKQRRLGRAVYK